MVRSCEIWGFKHAWRAYSVPSYAKRRVSALNERDAEFEQQYFIAQ